MAATINDKDKILEASAVRLLPTPGTGITFSNPAPVFKVTAGTVTPLSYAIEAKLTGQLKGTVTWSVLSGTINSTAGQNGNTWTIDYNNLLTDSAVVQASLTFLGSTYTNTFTISKIADARSVDLTMTSQAFVYNVDGQIPVPSNSVITATPQNILTTAFYEFIVGTTTVQNTTSNTYSYTPPAQFSSMPQQITVKLREGSNTSTVLATDVMSMTANKIPVNGIDGIDGLDGIDAVYIDLVSESDVTTAANDGTGYTLPTDNSVRLYGGVFQLSTGVVYGPATTTKNGLTATVNTTTGAITLSGASWTSDTESFDFTATFNSVVYTANYTIAKSKTGSSAVFIDLLQEADLIPSTNTGTLYTLPTGNSIRLYQGGAQLTSGVVYGPATTTKNGLTLAVNTTTGAITLSGASWSSDRELFTVTATFNSVVYSTQYSLTKAKQGLQGNSITGDTGPRNAQVYYYNPTPSSTAPTIPTAAQLSYNFSNGAAGSSNANWSASFNPGALTATSTNNKYWSVRVTFQEDSFNGTYTTTVSAAFTWQNLNGLVTFTNLANGQGSSGTTTTFINGGAITANSLSVDKITSGTAGVSVTNVNGDTVTGNFKLGSGDRTPLGNTAAIGSFTCSTNTGWALAGFNTNTSGGEWGNGVLAGTRSPGGAAIGCYSVSSQTTTQTNLKYAAVLGETGAGGYALGTKTSSYFLGSNPNYNNLAEEYRRAYTVFAAPNYGVRTEMFGNVANIGTNLGVVVVELAYVSDNQADSFGGLFVRRHISGGNKGQEACRVLIAPAYNPVRAIEVSSGAAYEATVGHFPGGITNFTGVHESQSQVELTVGDILIDVAILEKQDVANVFSQVEPSTIVNDTRVIGVAAYNQENLPIPFVPDDNSQSVSAQGFSPSNVEIFRELEPWKLRYTVLVNGLGEGQVNVCGEAGNIQAGDLIVTSSMRGKGMRQSDDLVRSYTVARARESVVFDSPSQVKMIACIYLCG